MDSVDINCGFYLVPVVAEELRVTGTCRRTFGSGRTGEAHPVGD